MAATLHTDRLVLDTPNPGDIQAVFELCQDPQIQQWLPIASPFERSDAEYFIDSYVPHGEASGAYTTWALRLAAGEPLIGAVEVRLDEAPASASLGCWIGAPYRGRGLMAEALSAVAAHAFAPHGMGLTELHWQGLSGNRASAALADSLGFIADATGPGTFDFRGQWRDVWAATLRPGVTGPDAATGPVPDAGARAGQDAPPPAATGS